MLSRSVLQFTCYEWMKSFASSYRHDDDKHKQPAWVSLLLGSTSKIAAATITYPYQVIKSRMQQRETVLAEASPKSVLNSSFSIPGKPRYDGMIDCIFKIYR